MSVLHVLGNAGFDLAMAMRRLPAAGETLVASRVERAPGGKGLNQAVIAARAGAEVRFCAAIGRDPDGDALVGALAGEALAFEPLRVDAPTDLSVVLVAPDGENAIVTAGACADLLAPVAAASFAAGSAWLLLQGNLSEAATAAAIGAASGRVMLNTAPLRDGIAGLLARCDVVVANAMEASALTGETPEAAADALHALGVAVAVVTVGARGAYLATSSGTVHLSAPPAHAVDTTGAGDALCGVLASGLLAGLPPFEALEDAQRVAAWTVGRRGALASFPEARGLRDLLRRRGR